MNRPSHLAASASVLALAALLGVSAARWRNHADLQREAKRQETGHGPTRVSNRKETPPKVAATERERERQADLLEDAGIMFRSEQPHFSLANEQGQVLDDGLTQAGVPLDKKDEIQAALDVAWTRILASMKERVQPDERNSDPAKGIRAYLIPAQMGLREEILGKLETDLAPICGKESAALLTRALHPGSRFGYFGRQSITVRISTGPDGKGKRVDCASFDPISGNRAISHMVTNPNQLRTHFGDAIEW